MRFWNFIKRIGVALQSPFLLLLRLYWGYQFMITGYGKFLDIHSIAEYFGTLGIPLPWINAYAAASTEFLGGILILLGLFTRIAAIPLLVVMITAFFTAEYDSLVTLFTKGDPDPFFSKTPFLFGFVMLILFIFGPGKYSFDYFLTGARKKGELP